jgi:hypothetical protein
LKRSLSPGPHARRCFIALSPPTLRRSPPR